MELRMDMAETLAAVMERYQVSRDDAVEMLCDAAFSVKLVPMLEHPAGVYREVRSPADVEEMRRFMKGDA